MERVNLLEYFTLAEKLTNASRQLKTDECKGGYVYFAIYELPRLLQKFIDDDNGFSTCKHPAADLAEVIKEWLNRNLMDNEDLNTEKLDVDFQSYQYSHIGVKINEFRNVFAAECNEVAVYSVGDIAIYKTASLVSNGSCIIPLNYHGMLPGGVSEELDNAGRCLAFDLETACGFHSLRALELVIKEYLTILGKDVSELKNWYQYIEAAKEVDGVPPKVTAMLDRMRQLDRNPLMHPEDVLDSVQAQMLFSQSSNTILEILRDIETKNAVEQPGLQLPNLPGPASGGIA